MPPRTRIVALALAASSGLLACQYIIGIDDERVVDRPEAQADAAADARPITATDAGTDAGDICQHTLPPGPPAAPSDAGADLPPLTFAWRNVHIVPAKGATLGFDLDGHCTGMAGSTTSSPTCAGSASAAKDFSGGVDDALALATNGFSLSLIDAGPDLFGGVLMSYIASGQHTLLLTIKDYNGQPNDDNVTIAITNSATLQSRSCDGGGVVEGGAPGWRGCDTWSFAENEQVYNGLPSVYAIGAAWVTNGRLVFQSDAMKIGLSGAPVNVHGVVLSADILANGDAGYMVQNGMLAGRYRAEDIATVAIGATFDPAGPICVAYPTSVDAIVTTFCSARDITYDADGGAACNGMSATFGFDAYPAKIGDSRPLPPDPCKNAPPACTAN
jgi:hypothetical protein